MGEVDGARARHEDIDLDGAARGVPSGEAADEDLVRRLAKFGALKEVAVIGVDYIPFDIFSVAMGNNDIDIVRDTASVGPESGSRTAKEADIRCDLVLDDVSCAPSNFPYLLFSWGTSWGISIPHV